MNKVLIIGAGISGLVAARELQNAGHEVVVIEKGKGVGGRMATRRMGDATFDHGAQFFTARSDEFRNAVQNWRAENVARKWFSGFPSPRDEKPDDEYARFCGARGMTQIAKFLARGLEIHLDEEIEKLERTKNGWRATAKSGREYSGDKLLLTAPAPQALQLFDTSMETLPDEIRAPLQSVRFEPCFAVLVLLKSASSIPAPGALYLSEEPLSFIADNFQKGVSAQAGAITIHSSAAFARAHYEDDQTQTGAYLIRAAREYIGDAEIESFQVRRWRYSKPENALNIGALAVRELNLCFAGDGLNGAKIEGAFGSGLAAARVL